LERTIVSDAERKFWPFQPRYSLIAVALLLVLFLAVVAGLRVVLRWPSAQSDNIVLIGVLLLSLLPIVLALLDVIIERGGIVEYGGVKIDFSRSKERGMVGITIAPNIGVQGQPVTDSSTMQILDTLRQATSCDVIIIDLEDGRAWWETRLFVLLAGAARLGKPDKVVFVGKDANTDCRFQGWSHGRDLLQRMLAAHPQYERSLQAAWAAAGQWNLVEPLDSPTPSAPAVAVPPPPTWLSGRLATGHPWMAFDTGTGLHNQLFAEQILQDDLGQKIETRDGPRNVTLTRLEELFRPVLNREHIDLNWSSTRQLKVFLSGDTPFLAITSNDKYVAIVSRQVLLSEVLRSLIGGTNGKQPEDTKPST
jgi:hypothetical protein